MAYLRRKHWDRQHGSRVPIPPKMGSYKLAQNIGPIPNNERPWRICVASLMNAASGAIARIEYDVEKYMAIPVTYRKHRHY